MLGGVVGRGTRIMPPKDGKPGDWKNAPKLVALASVYATFAPP